MPEPLPYRDFYYPLNVFMHILMHEEGDVRYLHYGIFERGDETLLEAQERSTALLLEQLPAVPARLLDVGSGVGTTLKRLTDLGYDVTGITPDAQQVSFIRSRYGDAVTIETAAFETWESPQPFDAVLFQESSQYIDSAALFSHAVSLTRRVIVLDEFATQPVGHLRTWDAFAAAAAGNGFEIASMIDLSERAAPTIGYFTSRLPRFRDMLVRDLALTPQQVDELIASGTTYVEAYRRGDYVYRLVDLRRP